MTKVMTKKTPVITKQMVIFFLLLGTFPFWGPSVGLYHYLGTEIAIWMIYALGYNLLLGYTGLPSFGHGAYFGVGAYAYGLTYLGLIDNVWTALAISAVAGAIAAGIVACFLSHRRGIYYALMTIAFGQVFWFIAIRWHSLTGGEDGLLNISRAEVPFGLFDISLRDPINLFYFIFLLVVVVTIGLWRLTHSPYGKALQAVRMNEMRAGFVGYNVWLVKWSVFMLSGAIAGVAGGLLAIIQESAYPDVMSLHASGFIVMLTLIGGGFVSFWGPVIGAVVFFLARDLLGSITETWLLWYGLMFMAVILFKPEGIAGMAQDFGAWLDKKKGQPAQKPLTNTKAEG
ncbi:branched-chain amino acid ABC transporter permease [Parasalinivibrio latis]|uniref:branched-chain amino acid ABC transporter permease n=1 Tax=Parasalinivibrio latis TaxID=2952610 RepID=UPI0030E3E7C8